MLSSDPVDMVSDWQVTRMMLLPYWDMLFELCLGLSLRKPVN